MDVSRETKQAFNPYLPSWEFIPDGEPHVFGDRLYVYGSHDRYNGHVYCLNDYVCWSAPLDDLGDWRYEGVIYPKTSDPLNTDGRAVLYAPDVTKGPDGRYYLYYVLDHFCVVSVAVCDEPAGQYEFYGYVHYADGTRLGERAGDQPQFDPAVLTEGELTYLYTGFAGFADKSRLGAMGTVLGPDMLTVVEESVVVVPGTAYDVRTEWAGHAFFEASSIRKVGDRYCFVYSSQVMHELCYALSDNPMKGFRYGGVLVSNCDIGIDSYKPASRPMAYGANNHGGMVQINGDWYIFYHRHTNGTEFSRQGCAQKLTMIPDRDHPFPQVEMTSCGLNGGPLAGKGRYLTYIACNLFTDEMRMYVCDEPRFPKIIKDGADTDKEEGYITNMKDSATAGFKYFDMQGVTGIRIEARGYMNDACFEVRTVWDGPVLGTVRVHSTDIWEPFEADIAIPDGINALYLTYRGNGTADLASFELR